ncbi:MAG: glycoside hydrolase family 1 protein [Deltaproteobacteria bacterium]|nr:glycoside hydrolase family 1 protein [Deltaproteobacteria bacterium]
MLSRRTIFGLSLLLSAVAGCGDDDRPEGGVDAGLDAATDASPVPDSGEPDAPWEPAPPFPDDFLWGSATAPYQIEGGLHDSDWYRWERLGKISSCDSADDGPDGWNLWEEDLDLARDLGTNAYRFGIDWSRLYPTREAWDADTPDAEAVQRYHDMLAGMRERGIAPMVTLQHFVLPTWLSEPCDLDNRPGWLMPEMMDLLPEWARRVALEFGDEVDLWITINEPMVYDVAANFLGMFPPGARHSGIMTPELAFEDMILTARHMIYAHAAAYDAIHEVDDTALVSIAKNNRAFEPSNLDSPADQEATDGLRYAMNRVFLDAIIRGDLDLTLDGDTDDEGEGSAIPELVGRADFIGLNYYSRTLVMSIEDFPLPGMPLFEPFPTPEPKTDFGWDIYPAGFAVVLEELREYGLPVYITENGIADSGDVMRATFVTEHLDVLARAIASGIDVRGYFHWSLMDNFEWVMGYCPRFGLYSVDFETKERTASLGAQAYAEIIAAGRVTQELHDRYAGYGEPTTCRSENCQDPAEECPE